MFWIFMRISRAIQQHHMCVVEIPPTDASMGKSADALATNNMRFRPQICTVRTWDRRKNRRGRSEFRIVR